MIHKIFKFIFKLLIGFILFSVLLVVLYRFVPVPYTPLMAIRYFESGNSPLIKHDWIPLEEISPQLQLAVITSEDQNFMTHNGFDMESIKKAYAKNKSGQKLRGGSTISQQTAKNVFLWPQRNWFRKGLEAWFTLLIENIWSKERILEVYLNSIEMGPGVYGAEAAARHWFGKPAARLNRTEAAAIAAILPNPQKYRANPRSTYIQGRVHWISRQMQNYGTFILKN